MKPITIRIEAERLEQFIKDMNRAIAILRQYTVNNSDTKVETYKYCTSTDAVVITATNTGEYKIVIESV